MGLVARDVRPTLVVAALACGVVSAVYGALDPAYTVHHVDVLRGYLDGVAALAAAHRTPASAFLFGQHYRGSRWWYYPRQPRAEGPRDALGVLRARAVFLRRVPAAGRRLVLLAVLPAALVLLVFT